MKLESINKSKFEDFAQSKIDNAFQILGGAWQSCTWERKDKNGNVTATGCDVVDWTSQPTSTSHEDYQDVPCNASLAPTTLETTTFASTAALSSALRAF